MSYYRDYREYYDCGGDDGNIYDEYGGSYGGNGGSGYDYNGGYGSFRGRDGDRGYGGSRNIDSDRGYGGSRDIDSDRHYSGSRDIDSDRHYSGSRDIDSDRDYGSRRDSDRDYGNYGSRRDSDRDYGSRRNSERDYGSFRDSDRDYGSRRDSDRSYGGSRQRDSDRDYGSRRDSDRSYGCSRERLTRYRRESSGGGWRDGGSRGGRDRDSGGRRGSKRYYPPNDKATKAKRARDEEDNWDEVDRHQLMQSGYMDAVPENFEQDWVFIVCPPGKRRVLVAANRSTQTYNSLGNVDMKFKSCLPNGNEQHSELFKYDDLTILDAVYNNEKKCFYIIDILHWKHYPYYDTEAEFRFFCLPDKYSQLKNPREVTEHNEFPLEILEKYPSTRSSIEKVLKEYDSKVEGLLFFKKSSPYVCKDSTDCLWLKLDQMEKVLGIPVPDGVKFAATNSKDEKRKAEQEERKRLKAIREAAKKKQEEVQTENDLSDESAKNETDGAGGGDEKVGSEDKGEERQKQEDEAEERDEEAEEYSENGEEQQ